MNASTTPSSEHGSGQNLVARSEIKPIYVAATLIAAATVLWPLDLPLAAILNRFQIYGDPKEILTVAETFGHGVGVAIVLIAVWLLSFESRRFLPALLASSLGSGIAADIIKLCVARQRPRDFEFASDSVLDTFAGFFPGFGPSAMQSFPSAHSATAVGFAVALAVCFPKGKWFFYVLAALTCFSRMQVGAHYLSDVLVGAAVGIVVATISLKYLGEGTLPNILSFAQSIEPSKSEPADRKEAA